MQLAYLAQDESGSARWQRRLPLWSGGGMLMEWAVGKQYDMYRPNTGKLLMPGRADFLGHSYPRGRRGNSR